MKYLLSFCLLFSFNYCLFAQTFSNAYDVNNSYESGAKIIVVNDGVLISVLARCENNSVSCAVLMKTDFDGNVLWERTLHGFKTSTDESFSVRDGFIYYVTQYNTDSIPDRIVMQKLNMDGEVVVENHLGAAHDGELPYEVHVYGEDKVLLTNVVWHPVDSISSFTFWLVEMNENLEVQNEVFYPDPGVIHHWDRIWLSGIIATPDGGILGGFRTGPSDQRGAVIHKMDADFNIEWTKKILLPGDTGDIGHSDLNFTNLKQGGYAVSWAINTSSRGDFYIEGATWTSPVIYGLDTEGNTVWESPIILQSDSIVYFDIYDLFTASNGDIVGCGEVYHSASGANCGVVIRMSAEGELKWIKMICEDYASYSPIWATYLWDGAELPNGDLMFTGGTADSTGWSDFPYLYPQYDVWLLRLDSDGCLINDCEWENDFVLEDITPSYVGERPLDFIIKPNPATQLTTLDFGEPLKEYAYLRLLSIDGRSVLERKLPKGQVSYQLPLTNVPDGLYFVQLRIGGERVIVKKLVVN